MIESLKTIPEELYNLTQLAEVTLAAGRLSTTNVNEIREYINKEKNKRSNDEPNTEYEENRKFNKSRKKLNIENNWNTNIEDLSYNLKSSPSSFEEHSVIKKAHSISGETQNCSTNNNNNNNSNNNQNQNHLNMSIQSSMDHMHLLSSSDDDSNYYSHKIFDRKKSRRSTISENYRFDELSCSSIPSCSSDEHQSSAGHSIKGTDGQFTMTTSPTDDDHHICPECGKKYSTSSNLARHRQTHRSILDKKARRCPHCEKVYVSMPAYSMHVRTHSQGCECPHCGKCFSRPWLLQGHIRTHTGEKPFKCNICTKAFADKSNLRAHIQTHSNTKPHSCSRCGKSFALKSYLYKHEESSCMRNHLKQDKDRPKSQRSDATKSSLVSKILQKDNNNCNSSSNKYDGATHINWKNSETLIEQNIITEDKTQKSYTTLTSPMSQDDYDRFTRISVIRPPITNPNGYDPNGLQMNFYQENPVDFSPKNNFTHSSKTSPFELTSSYAIVA